MKLRLKQQEQQEERRLRQREHKLENEKKAEAGEEQRLLKLELTKGSSRASGSVADELDVIDQDAIRKGQQGRQDQWLNGLSLAGNYLQTVLSTLPRMSHKP